MNDTMLKLYHQLPTPARFVAASLWGYFLRSWRYGPETDRLVEEIQERETWTQEHWKRWQENRLAYVLHRAATQVPYYREYWATRTGGRCLQPWEHLENWPILDKEIPRSRPVDFIAQDCKPRRMFHEQTSGTTGKSLDLWLSQDTVRNWYALFEVYCRLWNGVSRHDRWAILGCQLVTPVTVRRPPFWVWNTAMRQLYLSSYHLAPDLIPYYLDALADYRIVYLYGYPSMLYALALEVLRRGRRDLKMKVVITNAEPMLPHQRAAIAAAFQCPVRDTYSMSEIVAAASECPAGRMHLWPSVGIVEVFDDARPVKHGVSGDLVCTSLLNADMPLIRYRVGDRGTLLESTVECACGRHRPQLASLEGRTDDMVYTADGRRITALDPVFHSHVEVHEAQIIQETVNRVRVLYVPTARFRASDAHAITKRLHDRLGPIEVVLEKVEAVPRTSGNKLRGVICNLPAEQQAELTEGIGCNSVA